MEIQKIFSRIVPVIHIFLVLVITAGIFLLRAPVIIVTDRSFNLLYGAARIRTRQIELSVRHFQRIIPVMIQENSSDDIVAEIVKSASVTPFFNTKKMPRAVFFSGFFSSAAYRLKEEWQEVPIFILEGRTESRAAGTAGRQPDGDSPVRVRTDLETDLYRAGICAGRLMHDKTGRVLVYQDQILTPAQRSAVEKGLEAQGFDGATVYAASGSEYSSWQNISLVIVTGSSVRFFEQNQKIPAILFSWINPDVIPGVVRVIFDDSPWALAAKLLEMPDLFGKSSMNENPVILPSDCIIPKERLSEDVYDLEKLVKQNPYIGINQ